MSTGIVKSKASGIALMGKVLVGVMMVAVGLMPQASTAKSSDMLFQQHIMDLCQNPPAVIPANWDTATLAKMCMQLGGQVTGQSNVSLNFGTANAGSTVSKNKKKKGPLDLTEGKGQERGASSDDVGWGVLLAPIYGKSSRADTDFENGYRSTIVGMSLGLDYRPSDMLVLGIMLAHANDTATFVNDAGALKTGSDAFTVYGTYLLSKQFSIDGYLGISKLSLDSRRKIAWNPGGGGGTGFFGDVIGKTNGSQELGGVSLSYLGEGYFEFSPFVSFDYIKTKFNGYSESGNTTLEMRYGDRSVISSLGSIGVRMGHLYAYDWGGLSPSVRLGAVHEFQNRTRQIYNELVSTPGYGFSVQTDSPDRNYLNLGLGVSASLNRGGQLFLDYEKRTQDKLLSSWAVSLGGLFEF